MTLQNTDTADYMISDILSLIYKSSQIFHFKWVKGHSGVAENLLAELIRVAKKAVEGTYVTLYFFLHLASHLKYKLKQNIKTDWQKRWDNEDNRPLHT